MTALLELNGIDAHYGQLQALFGVDLAVEEGETVAMIGANGAGKTTLLHTIAGTLRPSRGAVTFAGTPLIGVRADRRVGLGIALVPEGRRLFPSLTVEENLLVGAHRRRPGPWNLARVYDLLPLLRPLRHRRAGYLSGGEQQAAAIGRALMANPRLLLFDEVSLGLAPAVVKHLYAALPGIVADGTTLIIVEQDIGQALAVARHVTCLLEGRVSLRGRPGELTHERITTAYFGI
jgi:branched-chain amino acid transport system ATP-binding protein